jgi:hypothetical protein
LLWLRILYFCSNDAFLSVTFLRVVSAIRVSITSGCGTLF